MNIYRWIKKRKTEQCTHKKSENHNYIKSDLKLLKAKKIIKQKSEIVSFLQQHGLHIDKHNHYIIYSDDINHMEEALSQAFPKLCASISTTEKEKQLFQISRKKDGTLLFQAHIKY